MLTLPLERLQTDFASAYAADPSTCSNISLAAWLQEALAAPGVAQTVPCLNTAKLDELPDGAIVRFVGMVQDLQDPEYYDGAYEEIAADGTVRLRTSMYQGCISDPPNGTEYRFRPDMMMQRGVAVCTPLPSRSAWVDEIIAGDLSDFAAAPAPSMATPGSRGGKRSADSVACDGDVEPMEEEDVGSAGASTLSLLKRTRAGAEASPGIPDMAACTPCGGSADRTWDRAAACGVLLKTYGSSDSGEALKMHELVEVYGVLERAPEGDVEPDDEMADMLGALAKEMVAERMQRPPPSAQPRVHAISTRRVAEVGAAVLPPPSSSDEAALVAATRAQLPTLRAMVLDSLAASVGGDALAAEYILLAAMSRIHMRHGDSPIGKLHVNLTGCPTVAPGAAHSPLAASLHAALTDLTPLCAKQSLSIAALNAAPLAPVKDHEANCIWPAPLQLPAGASLLLDEAMLSPGTLTDKGVHNVKALTTLIELQKVPYDFHYFSVEQEVDATVVAISSSKSMLPVGWQVPLRVAPAAAPPPELALADVKRAARSYVSLAARAQHSLAIGAELSKVAQEDFVAARQADASVTPQDFGRLLTCTRLLAASMLAPTVELEHYQRAKLLEAERVARVRSREVTL